MKNMEYMQKLLPNRPINENVRMQSRNVQAKRFAQRTKKEFITTTKRSQQV